jgi:hypothetical protein
MSCSQLTAGGNYSIAGRTALRVPASSFVHYRRATRAVNCTIHATTAGKPGIRSVHNGICVLFRYVTLY